MKNYNEFMEAQEGTGESNGKESISDSENATETFSSADAHLRNVVEQMNAHRSQPAAPRPVTPPPAAVPKQEAIAISAETARAIRDEERQAANDFSKRLNLFNDAKGKVDKNHANYVDPKFAEAERRTLAWARKSYPILFCNLTSKVPLLKLKILLKSRQMRIWRKLIVPSDIRLDQLHETIYTAMGWRQNHQYEFKIKGKYYGTSDRGSFNNFAEYRLDDLINPGTDRFQYIYDSGYRWVHYINIQSFYCVEPCERNLFCLSGRCSCPPEDVGGPKGYEHFCTAINDKTHPEHERMREWAYKRCGYPETAVWPDGFDIDEANEKLAAVYEKLDSEAVPPKENSPEQWPPPGRRLFSIIRRDNQYVIE